MRGWWRALLIRRGEWPLAVPVALLVGMLQVLMLRKYYALLFLDEGDLAQLLGRHFHLSGFDAITYRVLTEWGPLYDVVRHPLLHLLCFPFYLLNQLLWWLTGLNWAMPLTCGLLTLLAVYSCVFVSRIARRLVGLGRADALLVAALFCSLAYVLTTFIAPDHFALSLVLLLGVVLCLRRCPDGHGLDSPLSDRAWGGLLLLVAGVTLTNGAKVVLALLTACGRRFFQWRRLLVAVVVPVAVVLSAAWVQHRVYVLPKERAQQQYAKEHRAEHLRQARENHRKYKNAPWVIHKGLPLSQSMKQEGNELATGLLRWTDVTTDRWDTVVENLLGESMQFHETHMLEDVLVYYRPVMLPYEGWWHYALEGLLVLLFALGCWAGRRSPLLWMLLGWTAIDMTMHIGLGFAINEVYIMSAHWIFVVPLAIAFLLQKGAPRWQRWPVRVVLSLTTLYLIIYNVGQLVHWLQQPPLEPPFLF